MPWEVMRAGTTATMVAPPPTLQGLQFACVMLICVLVLATTVKVPLRVLSVAPAMVTLEPGEKVVNGELESAPTLELMVSAVSETAAPGAVSNAAGPAS